MLKKFMIKSAFMVTACSISLMAHAIADTPPKPISISAGALVPALEALSKQVPVELVYRPEQLKDFKTRGVKGTYTGEAAVRILLKDTPLELQTDPSGAMLIAPMGSNGPSKGADAAAQEGKKSSSGEFHVAQANSGSPPGSVAIGSPSSPQLTEVIVTAQKREERLQDVPVPVTAINAQTLMQANQLQIQDYYTEVPGLTLTPSTQSVQMLTIRGITTGAGNPTVGVTVDGVPFGSSTALGGGDVVPDIDPNDLARVEVLRGPQGTLYGASSMGGLLDFVTIDPSTDRLSGRVQAGTESIYNGSGLGYNFRGSVNIPLGATLAMRASAFTREDPGYIDNPFLRIDGINEQHAHGGRLATLWTPTETLSLKLSALYQEIRSNGSNDVDIGAGLSGLQQDYVRGAGGYDRKAQAYSAILKAKFGSSDFTSVTGFNSNSYSDGFDYTPYLSSYAQSGFPALGIPGYGVSGTPVFENSKTSKFTQELRLSIPVTQSLDWLVGAFYTHEKSPYVQNVLAENTATGEFVGTMITFNEPTAFSEYAGFTDVTYHFTDTFDVQVGVRESHIEQIFDETDTGPFVPLFDGFSSPRIYPHGDTSNNSFTYLFTPRYKFTQDLMLYARLASGYRAGGPNQAPGGLIPRQYNPDKTENYEMGFKGDFLEHRLTLDTSVYYIDWKQIQLSLFDAQNGFAYFANGGTARSDGIEFSLNSRPVTGLTASMWVAWNDAKLSQDLPLGSSVYGNSGDQLPYSARWSGNASLQQDFPISGQTTGFVGGSLSYVGNRIGAFQAQVAPPAAPPRQDYPAFARTDLRAGVNVETWTLNVFVNNVTDRRGLLQGGLSYFLPTAFVYIQPRTAGVSVVKTF